MSKIKFTINHKEVTATRGETILTVARRYEIYIPTMCYISKTTPCASCRLCVVEVKDTDDFVLSCNTLAINDIEITTSSSKLELERTNIMKLYDVNHPLECGVCDKSGECDLQNKTLEFNVAQQNFATKDKPRKMEHWGLLNYDPALCIMCEKCVHVCNEVIGDDAIEVLFGGYNSKIIPKNADTLDCTFCGECIAVCPVGAFTSSNFQYISNAWELQKIPATCVHCSAGCPLEYEIKHTNIADKKESIYRVTNNFEFSSLCGAGRFGFDFDNKATKDTEAFKHAIVALKNTKAIRFSSLITNEEALILNAIKKQLNIKLFNEDARLFSNFMDSYSSASGKKHYSASTKTLKKADGIIIIGSMVATDNPGIRYALTIAAKHNGAKIIYAHPIEDDLMQNIITQFLKYEVGTEEGVVALLAKYILKNYDLNPNDQEYFNNLDDGYLSAESNIGEDELELMMKFLSRTKNNVLVIGEDIITHARAYNIAKLVAIIEKYSNFKILIIPKNVNTLGVSLICDLDIDDDSDAVGYQDNGTFLISSLPNADLVVPSLNQQEGTFVSVDKQVVPTNAAVGFDGYELLNIAKEFGISKEHTIDFTSELPSKEGFKNIEFDKLFNFLSPLGEDIRGYNLDLVDTEISYKIEDIDDLPEFNGTVIYHVNPVLQFNNYTNLTKQLPKDTTLRGSAQFAAAARINDNDKIKIKTHGLTLIRIFKQDETLKGTIALNPIFDLVESPKGYRFQKSKITRVNNEQ